MGGSDGGEALLLEHPGLTVEGGLRRAISTMLHASFHAAQGGLVSDAASPYRLGPRAARLVDRIIE